MTATVQTSPPRWSPQEREAAAAQVENMLDATVSQWRAAMGLSPAPPAHPAATFAIDLKRIEPLTSSRPVFVIGEARSGTTAILRALRDAAGFFAWSEGHLFSALPPLLSGVRFHLEQYQQKRAHPGKEYALNHFDVYHALNSLARSFDAQYAQAAGGRRWADKTTDAPALLAVPLLARMYPGACFIFMHRHPLKVLMSRQKKFPTSAIEAGVHAWAATMRTWIELKQLLDPATFVEVPQATLAARSDDVVPRLAAALSLDAKQSRAMSDYLRRERPESTGSIGDDAEVFLGDLDWPADLKQWIDRMFRSAAGAYGYRLNRAEASAS